MLLITRNNFGLIGALALLLLQLLPEATSFTLNQASTLQQHRCRESSSPLFAYYSPGRSSSRSGKDRSKRQYRVNQLVQTELGRIVHTGLIKGEVDYLEDALRQRISIVSVDVSPDLRQARVSTSIRSSTDPNANPAVEKRRAYAWLVENSRALRHTLAQKMSHMKASPDLTFVQVDVAAAVDVMYLIDKVSKGFSRESVGEFGGDDDSLPRGFVEGMDFDEEYDEEEWDEEDDDFFDLDDDEHEVE